MAFCPYAQSTLIAFDSAEDPGYDGGFLQYSNGGFGFEVWDYSLSHTADPNPMILSTSNINGAGNGPGIDTDGRSWGVSYPYVRSSQLYREFSSPMPVGSKYSCLWDTGSIGTVGTRYEASLTSEMTGFYTVSTGIGSATANYRVLLSEVVGYVDTGIAWTDGGLKISLELLTANSDEFDYRFELEALATSQVYSHTGTTLGAGGFLPFFAHFAGANARFAPAGDYFVNEMKIEAVPEPATLAALSIGIVALVRRVRIAVSG